MPTGRDEAPRAAERRALETWLGFEFRDPQLLERAATHRSFAHEAGRAEHNEPLEFLGDAVLGFLVAERIARRRPDLGEGAMTRLRASLVNAGSLAAEAERAALGDALLLGRGEENSGGRRKASLLADAFEAVVGAMFLDGGIRPVRRLVRRLFGEHIERAPCTGASGADFKTALQEFCQARGWPLPTYVVVKEGGPDHARVFAIEVVVDGGVLGRGHGSAKRRAEQAAAEKALRQLTEGDRAARQRRPRRSRAGSTAPPEVSPGSPDGRDPAGDGGRPHS